MADAEREERPGDWNAVRHAELRQVHLTLLDIQEDVRDVADIIRGVIKLGVLGFYAWVIWTNRDVLRGLLGGEEGGS